MQQTSGMNVKKGEKLDEKKGNRTLKSRNESNNIIQRFTYIPEQKGSLEVAKKITIDQDQFSQTRIRPTA